jgi:PPM family protein phosphatase
MLNLAIAHRSEIGSRTRNEDALRVAQIGLMGHMVLADGAGGHQGGAEAARRVVDHIDDELAEHSQHGQAPDAARLAQAIGAAHADLQQQQRGLDAQARMHATVVALWLDCAARLAVWGHVGDTRLYHLRGARVVHTTADDSVVQSMVQAGWLSPAQAREHPHKNQLLAALGMAEHVEPHTSATELRDGDAFLLCTDGWWDPLDDALLIQTLARSTSPQHWLDTLYRHIVNHAPARQDNHSAIAVWLGPAGGGASP